MGLHFGLIGILGASTNYFFHKKLLNSRKEKYAGDIIELAKRISEGD